MKRRPREINVFSLSAIDLFACAMGAFILLSLILFQYYLKAQQIPELVGIAYKEHAQDFEFLQHVAGLQRQCALGIFRSDRSVQTLRRKSFTSPNSIRAPDSAAIGLKAANLMPLTLVPFELLRSSTQTLLPSGLSARCCPEMLPLAT